MNLPQQHSIIFISTSHCKHTKDFDQVLHKMAFLHNRVGPGWRLSISTVCEEKTKNKKVETNRIIFSNCKGTPPLTELYLWIVNL